jgi:hypothetical protein
LELPPACCNRRLKPRIISVEIGIDRGQRHFGVVAPPADVLVVATRRPDPFERGTRNIASTSPSTTAG